MVGSVALRSTTFVLLAGSGVAVADSGGPDAAPVVAVLRVGVHRDAGTLDRVAADGASGLCTPVGVAVQCPADAGPVRFRWAGEGGFVLTDGAVEGEVVVAPGATVDAWVLPPSADRRAETARLATEVVTPADVVDLFVRTGDHPVAAPSFEELQALVALAGHPNPLVRRELPEALLPWWRHTWSDPMPLGSPPVLPEGLVARLASDPDLVVRRRLASRLKDLREPGEPHAVEAVRALTTLATQGGGVQRAALGSLSAQNKEGNAPALETWQLAMDGLSAPGAPGRSAASALTALARRLEPGPEVDPTEAVERCLAFHPEKTWSLWNAWRAHVPLEVDRAERLVRGTVGWSPGLLKHWAEADPASLVTLLERLEPSGAHSQRWLAMTRGLGEVSDPALAALVERADNLSPASGPSRPE